ncbi:MAG: WD40 repeat domain-containing protein [Isosphaerales bacterium]
MSRLESIVGDSPDWLLVKEQRFPGPTPTPSMQRVLPMDPRLRLALILTTAAVALTTVVLVVWRGYIYPQSLVAALEIARVQDENDARDIYNRLRSVVFRSGQADELWAQFNLRRMQWAIELDQLPDRHLDAYRVAQSADEHLSMFPLFEGKSKEQLAQLFGRRALRSAFTEQRDEAILWWLKALAYRRTSEDFKRAVNGLIGTDYSRLTKTVRLKAEVLSPHGSVAISADSRRIAAGGPDGVVQICDLDKPDEPALKLHGATARVGGLAFSPDGRLLAATSEDGTVRVWDLVRQTTLLVFPGQKISTIVVTFSPDGQRLATGGINEVQVRDLKLRGDPPLVFRRPKGSGLVYALAFSPDGRRLAEGGTDDYVRVWDTDRSDGVDNKEFYHPQGPVFALAFGPDGRLASGGTNGVKVWDCDRRDAPQFWLPGTIGSVNSLAFDRSGNRLAAGYTDGLLRVWNKVLEPDGPPIVLRGSFGHVSAVAFGADARLTSVDLGGVVRVWDPGGSPTPLLKPAEQRSAVLSVAFDSDGHRLACGGEGGRVQIWDTRAPDKPLLQLRGSQAPVLSLAFDTGGRRLACGSEDGTLRIWDTSRPDTLPQQLRGSPAPILSLAFDTKGRHVAAGSHDGSVFVWSTREGDKGPVELKGSKDPVFAVVFDTGGRRLACGGADGVVRVWNLDPPPAPLLVLLGTEAKVFAVAFDASGRHLAAGGTTGVTLVWDLDVPEARPLELDQQRSAFNDVALPDLSDSRRLAFGGIHALAFSPDGASILSATSEWVHLVRLKDSRLVATSSRLLSGRYPPTSASAVRFLDSSGHRSRIQVAIMPTFDKVLPVTLDLDNSDISPIEGDPEELLAEWQKKLALSIAKDGKIMKFN